MWLGIDLGTLSLKARLFGEKGETLGEGSAPYDVHAPREGWSESDPEAWWDAAVTAVRDAVGERGGEVRGVGLSGQMHGVVLTRGDGAPLRPAILWSDGRSAEQLSAYRALTERQRTALANPLVAGMAGPTLLWLREHEPRYQEARWALQPKDWLRLRLTGDAASDPSDASGTLLYNPKEARWADELIEGLGLRADLLAPLNPSAAVAGTLLPEAAVALGLAPHLNVATGAADTAAAILGSGLGVGEAQLTVGSGAQIVVVTAQPKGAPGRGLHLFRTARENEWYSMAALQNAGLALEWAKTLLGRDWEGMYRGLSRTPPGAEGLTFLPYLTGERTPHLNPDARGGWLMASRRHTQDHFARAAFEGVAFSIADGFSALRDAGLSVERLRLAGGGTRERQWQQLLADVLKVSLAPITLPDASVCGAARLAAQSQGEDLPLEVAHGAPVQPNEQLKLVAAYEQFKEFYGRLFGSPSRT